MGQPNKNQNIQDWLTQKWVIVFGNKIDKESYNWLLGPFGSSNGIGLKFIKQLAREENLCRDETKDSKGLIESMNQLKLSSYDLSLLSRDVIDFYENTSNYDLSLKAKWNPLFKGFGILVSLIFSKRIEQLNIPIKSLKDSSGLTSEIIRLNDSKTNELKRTVWLRTIKATGQIVYSGVYDTCIIPSGISCIKAVFPLPNGNATVILAPKVGKNGELILNSSGQKVGDSGFYFLLKDSEETLWTKFIKSFKDQLVVRSSNGQISATQTLTLWNIRVLTFEYQIKKQPKLK